MSPFAPRPSRHLLAALCRDPRHFQIGVLGSLLVYGMVALGFPVSLWEVALLVGTALATQAAAGRLVGVRFDARSPLISALSLSLLARAASPGWLAATAVAAIGSKFLIRRRGKHVFNPTNFGLVAVALASGQVWVSPGQWGSGPNLALLLVCAGGLVVYRAARGDVTWGFLLAYGAVLFGRAAWLGDPWPIPLHALDNGALLIFAFFMISDPKTTPDSRAGRLVYAAVVALAAGGVHFVLFRPNGFIWALAACAPLVPLTDHLLPGARYRWPGGSIARSKAAPARPLPKEEPDHALSPI
ncbi:MAG: RnfABCDGE type electron transport complex subunit D [Thermoanaerobaculia bacterium]|nr:RnfABCDGE type electron transport complex subunit D [Thermoanaerobaculia bacterium]